jgi:hypothetical protein
VQPTLYSTVVSREGRIATEEEGDEPNQCNAANEFVFCHLLLRQCLAPTRHLSTLYRGRGLAYPWGGFVGAKKKTRVGLLVFGFFMNQSNLAELVTGRGVTVITFMSLNNKIFTIILYNEFRLRRHNFQSNA